MHAALVNLTIDPDQAPAAADALTQDILPAIRAAPGFIAGYWLEPDDGAGFSFVVFETEEQARRSAPPAGNWAAPGIRINDVDFRRVAASASAWKSIAQRGNAGIRAAALSGSRGYQVTDLRFHT